MKIALLLSLMPLNIAFAQESGAVTTPSASTSAGKIPPAKISISSLPSHTTLVDDVVVPVPSEIFSVLDKLGKPNWVDVLRRPGGTVKPPGAQAHTALLLGIMIAEGFIAVEAEDTEEVKKIGKSVLNLSKALAVGA